jgi:fructokinase
MSVVVAGEALVDLAPRDGLLLPLPGGSPYNVAIGLGRLGTRTHYLGGLSRDAFGVLMAERLRSAGVELDLAPRVDEPTTLAVVHLDDQGRASYGFYLDGTAAAVLAEDDLPVLPADAALHVSLGAIGLGHAPAGRALGTLLEAAHGERLTSLDPNVRPSVFEQVGGVDAYAALLDRLVAGHLDLVKVSDEDLALLHPEVADPLDVARDWARSGPSVVVVTRGPDGAAAVRAGHPDVEVAGRRVEVLDTVGAGDAFTSGLLGWLDRHDRLTRAGLDALRDEDLAAALSQAVEVAAITCTRAGSDPPRLDELTSA